MFDAENKRDSPTLLIFASHAMRLRIVGICSHPSKYGLGNHQDHDRAHNNILCTLPCLGGPSATRRAPKLEESAIYNEALILVAPAPYLLRRRRGTITYGLQP